MRRLIQIVLVLLLGLSMAQQATARRRVVVRETPRRTVVVVHRGWPLTRPARVVLVRPTVVAVHHNHGAARRLTDDDTASRRSLLGHR